MANKLKITDIERIVVSVPLTPRCQEWNAREVWQWQISEILRVKTDAPDIIGYGETILHYTWGRCPTKPLNASKARQSGRLSGRRFARGRAADGAL